MNIPRDTYSRGYADGIDAALHILDTETSITGADNRAAKLALQTLRDSASAPRSSPPSGEEPK